MTRPRIALLNAAHEAEGNRRNFRRELDADLTEFHLPTGQHPETFEFDGAVVTGSRASVYWDEEWIQPTKDWVGEAIDRGLPFLGVCYGHQLLADVLGGTVEPMGEYEIGYRTVEHSGDSVLFDGIDDDFTVFTTHSDYVAEIPPGAERLAANDYGVHGFRKERVFGVQFHPEYDMDTAAEVTVGKEGQLSEERIQSVLDGITPENFDAACEAKQVFDNFLAFVDAVDASGAVPADDAVASGD
ncbi:gamma-glutamyl-gamma-aminobutyrate hydrolase family protein [Halosimplex rubrum]|uniref:Gamma-glutamyl-gamma-aminobutyrate hydrolase family protein n=1 Tax=Halosimplex rubrum TaxID=869889 RepID=A0A7D5TB34_9EURY|nr:type 1 glutamine amidotransferase [Halosimplex rubrum]QLH76136.1 gamma-glutamyl-gamma-aminobutyrate hydrolase family protein [Halosimplex rubrum]